MARFRRIEEENDPLRMRLSAVGVLKRLLTDCKPIRLGMILWAFIAMAIIALSSIAPKLLSSALDILNSFWKDKSQGVATSPDVASEISRLLLSALALYLLIALISYGKMRLTNHTVSRYFTCNMRIRISDKLSRLPIKFIDNTKYGQVLSIMTDDVSTLGTSVHMIFDEIIMGAIQLVVVTVIMFATDIYLALIVVAIAPFGLILGGIVSSKSHKWHRKQHHENGQLYSHIEETYQNITTVKAFAIEDRRARSFDTINQDILSAQFRANIIDASIQPIMKLMQAISFAALCFVGGLLAVRSGAGVKKIAEMILYSQLFAQPFFNFASAISGFQNTRAAAERIYPLLEQPEMQTQSGNLEVSSGDVVFENVNFSYVEGQPVLKNLNLNIKSGQKVAIVGPTGGGKTTIVNILMRFYDADSGRILIDGQDILKKSRDSVREHIGMVLQDTWLFKGSIAENIAYGKPSAQQDEVERAAARAYSDHFISTLKEGYETQIDEDALMVSSGQKQLITIARALLANREILVLDEATSNVDTRTELLIQRAMNELTEGKTSLVIAHRLSTIVDADIILVVNNGEIIEQGTHSELITKQGFYSELYNSQYNI